MEDVQDQWSLAFKEINKAMVESAQNNGLIKKKPYDFKLFDIADMTSNCKFCRLGLRCEKHKIEKK